jgi:rhodanese-related sulfurtransferase
MKIFSGAKTSDAGIREVTVQDVAEARGNVRIVDVREPHEFTGELGRVPGAELVPLATVGDAAKAGDREAELVLVCRSGGRSGRATALLASMGFQSVVNMTGGMLAYVDAKLPVER